MATIFRNRTTAIWLALVIATLLSWDSGEIAGGVDTRILSLLVMVIAFVKVRFIGLEFMELRHMVAPLRLAFEAWVAIVGVAVMVFYWFGI